MKKYIKHLALLILINVSFFASAQSYVNLTIKYSVIGTNSGYDHLTKMRVFIDGNEAGDNTPKKQTIPNSIVVEVPKGNHKIRAVLLAKPENIWEERTKANNYSMDCVFEKTENFIKDKTIELDFDLKKYEVKEKSSTSELYTESSEFLDGNNSSKNIKSNTNSNNYQSALKAVNDYLKTFDNGYYGYLEVKDGYLYDRFKDGVNYCRAPIKELDKAEVTETNRKVSLLCKNKSLCLYSSFTSNNHESFSFSQYSDFNTQTLINLLNNLVSALNSKNTTYSNSSNTKSSSNTSTQESKSKLYDELKYAVDELNKHLPTLDNGRYKGIGIADGYIYSYYANNNKSKAKLEDIDYAEANNEYNYVKMACKGNNKCVYSTITQSYHDYFNFNSATSSINKTEKLVKNLVLAIHNYLGTNSSKNSINSNTANTTTKTNSTVKTAAQNEREKMQKERIEQKNKSTQNEDEDDFYWVDEDFDAMADVAPKTNNTANNNYQTALNNLNNYLKTFNSETYKGVEVKDGKVYFKFFVYGAIYNSSINIKDLINNTIVAKNKSAGSSTIDEVKIQCKGDKDCFYSTYNKSGADHFRFFSKTVKDFNKMEQLVLDFIKSLQL